MNHRKSFLNVKTVLFCPAMILGLILAISVGAEGEGTWEVEPITVCPSSSVCAEWDVGGTSAGYCCIPPESVGTSDLLACGGTLAQSCEGTY